jgi:hypothetical protein
MALAQSDRTQLARRVSTSDCEMFDTITLAGSLTVNKRFDPC